jgi:hypothetical protein
MSAEWIDACRHPVVPGTKIHAAAFSPLLLIVVWFSWVTFAILLTVSATMIVMQMKGREPLWVWRRFQSSMRSGKVSANPHWYRVARSRSISYAYADFDALRKVEHGEPEIRAIESERFAAAVRANQKQRGLKSSESPAKQQKSN